MADNSYRKVLVHVRAALADLPDPDRSGAKATLENAVEVVYNRAFKETKEAYMIQVIREGSADTILKAEQLAQTMTKEDLGSKW